MPYENNTELPEALKKLPKSAQTLFRKSFNTAYKSNRGSEAYAFRVAWSVVKKRFKKMDGEWVAKTDAFRTITYYSFSLKPAEEFVSRSEAGNLIQTYVLSDTEPDIEGKRPTKDLLEKWASQAVGLEIDTDHELWSQVTKVHKANVEAVSRAMKVKKGIAHVIDAIIDAGKLVVKVLFDKRYEKFASRVKGLSIEGILSRNNETNEWYDGDLLGATFAVGGNPYNPRAVSYYA